MFSFAFDKLKKRSQSWKIIINNHEIMCSKENAELISKKISDFISSNNTSFKEENAEDFFDITIPEFTNTLICSELDYQYFDDIFNLKPIHITISNKELLKIFADKLEIEQLSNLTKMFEQSYDLFTKDETIKIQKEISSKIIDITEDGCEQLIEYLQKVDQKNAHEKDDQNSKKNFMIDNDFLYSSVLNACIIRTDKIELLMDFLKKYQERTNGGQFNFFKKMILYELFDYSKSFEIRFIVRHLYIIKELNKEEICSVLDKHNEKKHDNFYSIDDIFFDEIDDTEKLRPRHLHGKIRSLNRAHYKEDELKEKFTKEQLIEYAKMGSNPNKIYQAIKRDDIDSFTQFMSENSAETKFNDNIETLVYESNSILLRRDLKYLDLCAFYGSEKIFNYILLNVENPANSVTDQVVNYAFSGGNATIIHKCIEYREMRLGLIIQCLLLTIEYHRHEVFEWLIETYDPFSKRYEINICSISNLNMRSLDESLFLEHALRYNNYDALFYLISIGADYSPLFSLSMLFNNFYLTEFALKLQYNCKTSCKLMKKKNNSPFLYTYKEIFLFFLT